jgi:acyl-coenzyme A thioesterase PaaI-like protein
MTTTSLQQTYAPNSRCFGCGPANDKGLRIASVALEPTADTAVVCTFQPSPWHIAFETADGAGILNGGIVGTLLDCHSNWTAAHHLMRRDGLDRPPTTVTADFLISMKRPTPTTGPVELTARATESNGRRVTVEAELRAGGVVTATCLAHFVAVPPGHPAHDRW